MPFADKLPTMNELNERVIRDDAPEARNELESCVSPGDVELIAWTIALSPTEGLAVLQDFVDTFWTPNHG
jgi:hypothetical protein